MTKSYYPINPLLNLYDILYYYLYCFIGTSKYINFFNTPARFQLILINPAC